MFFVYILVSEARSLRFYVGMSEDPEKRLAEHNSGKTLSTKGYRPWQLFSTEQFATRLQAREKEKHWKSGIGKERIKEKWRQSIDN